MSSGPSWRLAPASAASVCWKPFSFRERKATWISVAVTPLDVAPPLFPLKAMHGGEYGSPGTWSLRSVHALLAAAAAAAAPALAPPAPPPAAAVPPPAVPAEPADPAVPASPPTIPVSAPPPAPAPAAVTLFGDFDGTSSDISNSRAAKTAKGP